MGNAETTDTHTIRQTLEEIRPEIEALRHELHEHPEIRFEEKWTSDRVAAYLDEAGVPFHGFWLDAALEQMKARVTARESGRGADASDADARVVEMQTGYDLGPIRWQRLAAEGSPVAVADMAIAALEG